MQVTCARLRAQCALDLPAGDDRRQRPAASASVLVRGRVLVRAGAGGNNAAGGHARERRAPQQHARVAPYATLQRLRRATRQGQRVAGQRPYLRDAAVRVDRLPPAPPAVVVDEQPPLLGVSFLRGGGLACGFPGGLAELRLQRDPPAAHFVRNGRASLVVTRLARARTRARPAQQLVVAQDLHGTLPGQQRAPLLHAVDAVT